MTSHSNIVISKRLLAIASQLVEAADFSPDFVQTAEELPVSEDTKSLREYQQDYQADKRVESPEGYLDDRRDAKNSVMRLRVQEGFSATLAERAITNILSENILASMATVAPSGVAHANTLYFAWSSPARIYFISHERSNHALHLQKNPSAALTVYSSFQPWGEEKKGLQMFGHANLTHLLHYPQALAAYTRRFPEFVIDAATMPAGQSWTTPYKFFTFDVEQFKIFDERTFGEETYVTVDVDQARDEEYLPSLGK